MRWLAVCAVIALVGCAKHPKPPPLYPPGAIQHGWEFKDFNDSQCIDANKDGKACI